jgi:hypothetical protein
MKEWISEGYFWTDGKFSNKFLFAFEISLFFIVDKFDLHNWGLVWWKKVGGGLNVSILIEFRVEINLVGRLRAFWIKIKNPGRKLNHRKNFINFSHKLISHQNQFQRKSNLFTFSL